MAYKTIYKRTNAVTERVFAFINKLWTQDTWINGPKCWLRCGSSLLSSTLKQILQFDLFVNELFSFQFQEFFLIF
ncbi:unnamed protein product [Allacma fusca]|uniref:Uncharacterized protein n=1 Tax=Allacma fusca TaxID=39272 RepID=A0A8J2LMD2_9HEXA|nr:unnamed protein product [Allacma fusca]